MKASPAGANMKKKNNNNLNVCLSFNKNLWPNLRSFHNKTIWKSVEEFHMLDVR